MNKNTNEELKNDDNLMCVACNVPLEEGKVFLSYLNIKFPTKLLKCPKCGICFISEDMALKKAVEVEKTMEEK